MNGFGQDLLGLWAFLLNGPAGMSPVAGKAKEPVEKARKIN